MKQIRWTLLNTSEELGISTESKIRKIKLPAIEYCGLTVCLDSRFDRRTYYDL